MTAARGTLPACDFCGAAHLAVRKLLGGPGGPPAAAAGSAHAPITNE